MDLRYLEFLLASYSWGAIVFSAIMVLWLVLNNISEIAVAGITLKPRIAFRSLGSLVILMVIFSFYMRYVVEQIPPETALQERSQYGSNQDGEQITEQWRAFFERITHETNTMAFAFIRPEKVSNNETPDPANQTFYIRDLGESSVQYSIKLVIYILPIAFLIFEVGMTGYLIGLNAEAVMSWVGIAVVGFFWVLGVKHAQDQITDIILELARLTL